MSTRIARGRKALLRRDGAGGAPPRYAPKLIDPKLVDPKLVDPKLVDSLPQAGDQLLAVGEMPLLHIENAREAAFLERQHVDPAGLDRASFGLDAGGVADDVDQPVEGMQAAEQVVVLAIGAREECGEMAEADALEAARCRRSP